MLHRRASWRLPSSTLPVSGRSQPALHDPVVRRQPRWASSNLSKLSQAGRSLQRTSAASAAAEPATTAVYGVPTPTHDADADDLLQLPFYSAFPLDRRAELRKDDAALAAFLHHPEARAVLVDGAKVLVLRRQSASAGAPSAAQAAKVIPTAAASAASGQSGPALQWAAGQWALSSPPQPALSVVFLQPASSAAPLAGPGCWPPIFLGVDADGRPYFAAAVADPAAAAAAAAMAEGSEWQAARVAGAELPAGEAALGAVAAGLCGWHHSNRYDSDSGSLLTQASGGYSRVGPTVGPRRPRSRYPRIDPAVIMLITCEDYCLLGRKRDWPPGRYSTLAGFLEVGEPLEAAVVREVCEESGVVVPLAAVRYVASQPWPFPTSLMVGFTAIAEPRSDSAADATSAAGGGTAGGTPGDAVDGMDSESKRRRRRVVRRGEQVDSPAGAPNSGAAIAGGRRGRDLLSGDGRRAALDVGITPAEVESALLPHLQAASAEEEELEDVRWFHRDWMTAQLSAHIQDAGAFNIPGTSSLAHRLITQWLRAAPHSPPAPSGAAVPAAAAPAAGGPWRMSHEASLALPQVQIDQVGVFKYVLLRVSPADGGGGGGSSLLVRGDVRAGYHNELFLHAKAVAAPFDLAVVPLGGGRIEHNASVGSIRVFGYSSAFGPAPHEVTAALLQRWYPLYQDGAITVSYEGY